MTDEVQDSNSWHGMGFLRELMKASQKKTNQVQVMYAAEQEDGTIEEPKSLLADAFTSEAKDPHIWIVRPKWVKEAGKWKSTVPPKHDATRWFRIDVAKSCRAFVGNVLAGPKGKGYLELRKTLRVALRSGDFNAKVRSKMFGALGVIQTKARTMKDIEKMVGAYIAYLTIEYASKPAQMARHAYRTAGRWSIIDHIANDLRNDGDRTKLKALRDVLAAPILATDYKGVPDALAAALRFIQKDKELGVQLTPLADLTGERLSIFAVDIFFRTNPEIQNVFAMEGRHRMRTAAERKILGQKINTTMTKQAGETKLAALPPFNTKRKRKWLANRRKSEHLIYNAARQANTMPEDMKNGTIGFRIGGQGGQRSSPATAADGSLTMFLTPMLALADAARRGETSTVLWCARFSKAEVSLHTGTISGVPKQGFTYLDIGKLLATHGYQMSQYLFRAAHDVAQPEQKDRLAMLSITFTLAGPTPSYKAKLRDLALKELIFNPEQPIRDYVRMAKEGSNDNPIHAAFWPTSIAIEHVGSDDYDPKLGHLMFGTMLQEILKACENGKQRRWAMYEWLDSSFSSAISSFALVEALRVMHNKGAVVTQ